MNLRWRLCGRDRKEEGGFRSSFESPKTRDCPVPKDFLRTPKDCGRAQKSCVVGECERGDERQSFASREQANTG